MKLSKMAMAALAVAGAGAIPAQAKADIGNQLVQTIGVMLLADRLGIDPNMAMMALAGSNGSIYDMAPAYSMAPYGTLPPDQLWAMRNEGYSWNQIGQYSGVPASTYTTLVHTNQLNPDYIWVDELHSRYGIPTSQLWAYRNAGYSWDQIAQAAVTSSDTGMPVQSVLYQESLYGSNYVSPAYYNPQPLYIPPRNPAWTTFTEILPPLPRYAYNASIIQPYGSVWSQPVAYPTSYVVERPVVVRWSPVIVVRRPLVRIAAPRYVVFNRNVFVPANTVRVVRPVVSVVRRPVVVRRRTVVMQPRTRVVVNRTTVVQPGTRVVVNRPARIARAQPLRIARTPVVVQRRAPTAVRKPVLARRAALAVHRAPARLAPIRRSTEGMRAQRLVQRPAKGIAPPVRGRVMAQQSVRARMRVQPQRPQRMQFQGAPRQPRMQQPRIQRQPRGGGPRRRGG